MDLLAGAHLYPNYYKLLPWWNQLKIPTPVVHWVAFRSGYVKRLAPIIEGVYEGLVALLVTLTTFDSLVMIKAAFIFVPCLGSRWTFDSLFVFWARCATEGVGPMFMSSRFKSSTSIGYLCHANCQDELYKKTFSGPLISLISVWGWWWSLQCSCGS